MNNLNNSNRWISWIRLCCFVCLWGLSCVAWAHKPSDSYLFILDQADGRMALRWDIALRDLEQAVGVDRNHDGNITWGELRQQQTALTAYALSRLQLQQDQATCHIQATQLQTETHTDGHYAVLWLDAGCPPRSAPAPLTLEYHLLFDMDVTHRGIVLDQRANAATASFILSQEQPRITINPPIAGSHWQVLFNYVQEGIHHILIGFDHLLFISMLILPAVLLVKQGQWQAVSTFRPAFMNLLKVITAFTVAHSITLSLAVLGIVDLPSRWVESAIALSIIVLAVNILYPIITHDHWKLAFTFGLLHGFGFASVLMDLNMPRAALAEALLGFNIGVEIGQLAVVSLLFPLVYLLRVYQPYRTVILHGSAILTLIIASKWLLERAFNTTLLL